MWLIYAISAAVLWGLNYALAERILLSISPITLLAFEMLFGAIVFFALGYVTDLKIDIVTLSNNKNLVWLISAEIIVVLAASLLICYSIQAKNATFAGIIELLFPLFTIFFTAVLFNENHLNTQAIIGGVLIFIGASIVSLA